MPNSVEEAASGQGQDAGLLTDAGGSDPEIEVVGNEEDLRALVDQGPGHLGPHSRIGFRVAFDRFDLAVLDPAFVVDLFDRDLRAALAGDVEEGAEAALGLGETYGDAAVFAFERDPAGGAATFVVIVAAGDDPKREERGKQ